MKKSRTKVQQCCGFCIVWCLSTVTLWLSETTNAAAEPGSAEASSFSPPECFLLAFSSTCNCNLPKAKSTESISRSQHYSRFRFPPSQFALMDSRSVCRGQDAEYWVVSLFLSPHTLTLLPPDPQKLEQRDYFGGVIQPDREENGNETKFKRLNETLLLNLDLS